MPGEDIQAPSIDAGWHPWPRPQETRARARARGAGRAATRPQTYSCDVAVEEGAFLALAANWRDLDARAGEADFFTTFDWAACWWSHFGQPDGARPAVVTVRRDGRLVAVAPLAVYSTPPASHAVLMGAGTGQYGDVLVDPELLHDANLRVALWDAMARAAGDSLHVDNVRDNSVLAALIAPQSHYAGRRERAFDVDPAAWTDLDAYLAARPARLRKDLRRRRRRLADEGAVVYSRVTGEREVRALAAQAADLKRGWLAARGLHGRFLERPGVDAWFADVVARAGACGRLHASVLRVGSRLAAAQIGFLSTTRLVGYFAAFDTAYSRHAVGKLHLEDHIADVFADGRVLDLLPPADNYKREWARPGVAARSYCVPLTARGRIATLVHNPRLRETAKDIYLALPGSARAGIAARALAAARRLREGLSPRPAPAGPRPITATAKDQET